MGGKHKQLGFKLDVGTANMVQSLFSLPATSGVAMADAKNGDIFVEELNVSGAELIFAAKEVQRVLEQAFNLVRLVYNVPLCGWLKAREQSGKEIIEEA